MTKWLELKKESVTNNYQMVHFVEAPLVVVFVGRGFELYDGAWRN